ncbi:MAG: class I SAM-dependent methyltransferase [Lentisphaerae bacterium]|nr:class I SAM-dependent methyltransferase [Lentisphaerota bacterium]
MSQENPAVTRAMGAGLFQFRHSVPLRLRLHETIRLLGNLDGMTCLDVGSPNGALSGLLRKQGGKWHSAVLTAEAESSLHLAVEENVHRLTDRTMPFKRKSFDVVVIFQGMDAFHADEAFIEECHRVLKPDGRLIANVHHDKPYTLLRGLRSMLRTIRESPGLDFTGYSEAQLFSILKHGFDVHNLRSYSRFFVELVDAIVTFILDGIPPDLPESPRRIRVTYMVAGPFYWIASQLDLLLFFTRGHYLVATAKRRAWRPRNAPVLVDGRSISEAVLSKALD